MLQETDSENEDESKSNSESNSATTRSATIHKEAWDSLNDTHREEEDPPIESPMVPVVETVVPFHSDNLFLKKDFNKKVVNKYRDLS